MKHYLKILISVSIVFGLYGCGSSSLGGRNTVEESFSTAKGRFIDSPVQGLNYVSGDTTGVTDSSGKFIYEIIDGTPQTVDFYIGSLLLGNTTGKSIVTPVNLISLNVARLQGEINIVRLVLALDDDQNSNNGINLTQITDNADPFNWSKIDFENSDFPNQTSLSVFLSDVSSILQRNVVLADTSVAQAHINKTYQCLISGNYFGTFTGTDTGPIVLGVDPSTNLIAGVGWSRLQSTGIGIPFSTDSLNRENEFSFTAASDIAYTFVGQVDVLSSMSGTWSEGTNGGVFNLLRLADSNDSEIAYKFTGSYLADIPGVGVTPIGAYSINIYNDGTAQGELVNIIIGTTQVTKMTGNINNNQISMTATNGMTLAGIINLNNMTITGQWADTAGILKSGNFSMNGCAIN
ncbi:MAG: hypothetical protein QM504_12015 [Pseudomonadota bacterium]